MEGSMADGWADNIKPLLLRSEARARVRTRARYLDRESWAGLSACLLNGSDDWSPDPASCLRTISSNQSQLDELSQVRSRPSPCRKLAILNKANVWKCHNYSRYIWKHCQRHNGPDVVLTKQWAVHNDYIMGEIFHLHPKLTCISFEI